MNDDFRDGTEFPPPPDPYDGDEPTPPDPGPPLNLPPWEDRERFGLVSGFLSTIPQVLTAPGRFFEDHPVRRGLWGPISFRAVLAVLTSFVGWIWSRVFTSYEASLYEMLDMEQSLDAGQEAFLAFFEGIGMFLAPVIAVVGVFITAGLIHLTVKMVSSRPDAGFEASLRAVAYGEAATIIGIVPACGSFIGLIWGLVLTIIGVRTLHGLSSGQAMIAVLAPMALCCCGVAAMFIMAMGVSNL